MRLAAPAALLIFLLTPPAFCAGEGSDLPSPTVQIVRFPPGVSPEAYVASLAAAGVKEAIVRVFSNPGDRPLFDGAPSRPGVLFATSSLGPSSDLWTPIRDAAARVGIAASPWVATRSLPREATGGEVEEAFSPGSGIVPMTRMSIFSPRFTDRLTAALCDLAIGGARRIYLQDDWLLRWGEPLSPAAREAFLRATGASADPASLFPSGGSPNWRGYFADPRSQPALSAWLRWKGEATAIGIASFQSRVGEQAPGTILIPSIPYEVPAQPDRGLAWYGLSLAELRKNGIPEVAVMAYHRQMMQEMGISGDALRDYLRAMAAGLREAGYGGDASLIKLQGVDWKDGAAISAAELSETARPFSEAGFTRFAVVLSGVPYPAGFPAKAAP
jgi:hypothetical protein